MRICVLGSRHRRIRSGAAELPYGGTQAAFDAVALDGVADPLRQREADAHAGDAVVTQAALNRHALAMKTAA